MREADNAFWRDGTSASRRRSDVLKEQPLYGNYHWGNYKVCGVCGRDNSWDEDDWPNEHICPNCKADEALHRQKEK